MKMTNRKESINIVNRKAKFDYEFIRVLYAGMKLVGSEVKGIRDNRVSFVDSFCIFTDMGLELRGLHITPPPHMPPHEPTRQRILLLKKSELEKLQNELDTGMTIVPYRIFENERGFLKIEIALARGKKNYDKRESIKERDIKKETQKQLNERI